MLSSLTKFLHKRREGPPRLMAYCASNIGMGHYFRLMRVIEEIRRRRPEFEILLATDAQMNSDQSNFQLLQLPGFRFIDEENFKENPIDPNITSKELRDRRAALLLDSAKSFLPDILFMDTNPHGKRDELLPVLKHLNGRVQRILMMRDVPCPPDESFKLNGPPASIRKHAAHYDRFLLAGDAQFFDSPSIYQWPNEIRDKSRFVGFVVPKIDSADKSEILAKNYPELGSHLPLIVASCGGGWEVEQMTRQLLEGLRKYRASGSRPVQMLIATGPAISGEALHSFMCEAKTLGGVIIDSLLPKFSQLLPHADLAILQAGSTPFQILETDISIILTAREYKSREQDERAQRLAALPGIRLINRDSPDWQNPADWIAWGLDRPRQARKTGFNFNGIQNAANAVLELL